MPDSERIVFLPLVGAILGGIVGAVGGAWANSWYRDREAKKAEDRERIGLMSLISAEVIVNDTVFMTANQPADVASSLETSVWDQSQIRLAHLLPASEIKQIIVYYGVLKLVREDVKVTTGDLSASKKEMISTVRSLGEAVSNIVRKYVDDPFFLTLISRQQDEDTEEASPT